MLDQFIGQERIIEELKIAINAARVRQEPLGHCLFSGQPGLGKSTLARLIASEMGCRLLEYTASNMSKTRIEHTIWQIQEGDVLFISEAHNFKLNLAESLYNLLETWYYYGVRIPRFTMIIDTNYLGEVYRPLRDRFIYQYIFEPYTKEQLIKMIDLPYALAERVASRSRGVPRIALRYQKKVLDQSPSPTIEDVETVFKRNEVDELGLTKQDKQVMMYLRNSGAYDPTAAVGEVSIYSACGIEKEDYRSIIEPYLLQIKFIQRTSRGRILTHEGLQYVNKEIK